MKKEPSPKTMQITSIRFDFNFESRPGAGELLAFASTELDGAIVIRRMRIVGYPNGRIHIFMPPRLVGEKFEDIVYPSSKPLRNELYNRILEKLEKEFNGRGDSDKRERVVNALKMAQDEIDGEEKELR
jgi:DNA-binding cell septation regulator SpoVG